MTNRSLRRSGTRGFATTPGTTDDSSTDTDLGEVGRGDPSIASPPARMVVSGSGGCLLRGVVVSGDAVHDPDEVLLIGDELRT